MSWLKKNVSLVVGGVVALGLLGFAIFFLLTSTRAADEVTAQLSAKTAELKDLTTHDPYPNQENIEAARKEQKKLAAFKDLLQTTISHLEQDAEKAGVNLPAKYDFTFTPQRKSLDFAADTVAPLAAQVAEIKAVCEVLFNARVHALTALRRLPVAKDDQGATDYLLGKKAATNAVTGAVLAPYEIQFQGFTAELAAVLEGFYRSSNCFIVRNLDVQTNIVNVAADSSQTIPSYLPYYPSTTGVVPPTPSPEDLMRQRYGLGRYGMGPGGGRYGGLGPGSSRYGQPPLVAPTPTPTTTPSAFAPAARKGPETILDERPFKVTMYVEAVRLTERGKSKSAK
ncbi:MAG: hypothetical protein DME22_02890 [Verrucomicrobia bacterium]|nr:MAG: hypothetical protein DME22_02890 [Verrucomicrobiota bacterium]